jgi:hypothetical protein
MDLEQEKANLETPQPRYQWYHKVFALLVAAVGFEVGLFLIIFPWMEPWSNNYFATLVPEWRTFWVNAYVRGAISGLGVVNVVVALSEVFRLRRFSVSG